MDEYPILGLVEVFLHTPPTTVVLVELSITRLDPRLKSVQSWEHTPLVPEKGL